MAGDTLPVMSRMYWWTQQACRWIVRATLAATLTLKLYWGHLKLLGLGRIVLRMPYEVGHCCAALLDNSRQKLDAVRPLGGPLDAPLGGKRPGGAEDGFRAAGGPCSSQGQAVVAAVVPVIAGVRTRMAIIADPAQGARLAVRI